MPDSYIVNDKPEPLTIRVMYNAGNSGLFSFHQYPNSNPEKSVVVSEGGWGYPGYFQMLALKDADGEFALPKNCTELTVILDYRFVDEESSTGSMKMMQFSEMSPDKYVRAKRALRSARRERAKRAPRRARLACERNERKEERLPTAQPPKNIVSTCFLLLASAKKSEAAPNCFLPDLPSCSLRSQVH
jgi:hypothetical protein